MDGNGIKSVVDFSEVREQRLDEKRRKTERIFFKQMLGVYCVTSSASKMKPIEVIDVSENGCSFQVPFDSADANPIDTDDLPIRLYFSQDTYIEVRLKVQNSRPCIDNGARYVRYGCLIDETLSSYPAYQGFVRFLKLYSEHAHKDKGDVSVFYL